jgi:tetratricopeptide (TPR) repeat protein
MTMRVPMRAAVACALAALAVGCTRSSTESTRGSQGAKIPITTSSEEARALYLEGRDLSERLRAVEARERFQEAVELDPGFGLAWLGLATTAPSAKDFWDAIDRATTEAAHVSEGERHMILGFSAGVRSDPAGQARHYEALTAAFPEDERAHNLLGAFYFGRQEYGTAIEAYDAAIAINPDFSQPYNQKGYAHRFRGELDEAEAAFKRYIELIPDDPNPYDSYAELLMKTGRFEESIQEYEKALEQDPHFVASYIGIGLDRLYMGDPDEARATFESLVASGRTSGEKRGGLLRVAQSWVFEGQTDEALATVERMSTIAEAEGDRAAVAGDLNLMGNILLEAGRPDEALARFEEAVETSAASNAAEEAKLAARRNAIFNEARVALARGELESARSLAEEYAEQVGAHEVAFEQRQSHELNGLLALAEKNPAEAVAELQQANPLDPRVQYQLAIAYEGAGDEVSAAAACRKAAEHNGLNFNYAYVRDKATERLNVT